MKLKFTPLTEDEQLNEAVRGDLYHKTSFVYLNNILKEDKFILSSTEDTSDDSDPWPESKFLGEPIPPGKPYYLSMARTPRSDFILESFEIGDVVLVLDGNKLSNRYTIKPVYWHRGSDERGRKNATEFEERLWNSNPEIPNATKYIKAIHALLPKCHYDATAFWAALYWKKFAPLALKMIDEAEERHSLPLFFYTNKADVYSLNSSNAVPNDEVRKKAEEIMEAPKA